MFPQVLRELAPPIVVERLRGGRRYPSWESAKAAAGDYGAEQLNRFRLARSAGRHPDGSMLRSNALALVMEMLGGRDRMVTDFGGATGDFGQEFLSAFPRSHYTVVEHPALISLIPANSRICFTSEIPAACDVFFSSGTLQYVDNPAAVLEAGFASALRAVVLARNSFSDVELFRVQRSRLFENGAGPIPGGFADRVISYPHRTINENDVHAIATAHGFRPVASIVEHDGVLPYRRQVYGRQLVFLR